MPNTSRRNLFKVAGAAGVAAGLGMLTKSVMAAELDQGKESVSGALSSATVTLGGWQTGPLPFDRFAPNNPNDITRNHHRLTPNVAKIEEGGTVNFIISGFHNLLIYDHGTQPTDIDTTILVPGSSPPGLIADPDNRIYRGLDPRTVSQDRVETVQFATRGIYLVICGVLPHFSPAPGQFEMFGFVRVVKEDDDKDDDKDDD